MSLSYERTITVGSGTTDACNRGGSNDHVVTVNSSNVLKVWDISSGSQVGSNITTLSGTRNVCTVNQGASACVFSVSSSSMSWVELPNGYVVTVAGGASSGNSSGKGQMCAANSNGVVFSAGTAGNNLAKFVSSTGVFSSVTLDFLGPSTNVRSILALESNNFLIGTTFGDIFEINESGECLGSMSLSIPNTGNNNRNTSFSSITVNGLSYYLGSIIASTSYGAIFKINWATKQIEFVEQMFNSNDLATPLCPSSSGTTITGQYTTSGPNSFGELDFTVSPWDVRDMLYTDSSLAMKACGILNSRAWALQTDMVVMGITQRSLSTRNVSISDPGLVSGRMISLIDDGAGNMKVELDCALDNSVQTLPVTPGKTIYEVVLRERGVNERAGISKFNT